MLVDNSANAQLSETGIDELNVIFQVFASVDAQGLDENVVINLGQTADGTEVASLGRADFDQLSVANATLNIHASQQNVEIDYKKDTGGNLVVNFENNDGAIEVGRTANKNTAIEFLDGQTITFNHLTDQSVLVRGATNLDNYTTDVVVTTTTLGGDLEMGLSSRLAVFESSGELRTITIDALNGDMYLLSSDVAHNNGFLVDDATNIQTISVTGHDATMQIGSVGEAILPDGVAEDLETISMSLSGSATLYHRPIIAYESDIAEVKIVTASQNVLSPQFPARNIGFQDYNLMIEGLSAQAIERMVIDTGDGGNLLLYGQAYYLGDAEIFGSGDLVMGGIQEEGILALLGNGVGVQQSGPIDATDHTGQRTFVEGKGYDIIYGSTEADTVIFQESNLALPRVETGGVYYDSGGDDLVIANSFAFLTVYDGDAGSNDTYAVGENTFIPNNIEFHAGSGNDTITFETPFFGVRENDVLIDFGTWIDGRVDITGFFTNSLNFPPIPPTDPYLISLDGMPGITTSEVTTVAPGVPLTHIDDNSIYLGFDGDQTLNGSTIADYHDLQQVASYLNQAVSQTTQSGDSAIFILANSNSSVASGNEADYYFYLFNESDGIAGVHTSELSNFATVTLDPNAFGPPLSDTHFV
jgi:hypothetical protein